MAQVPSEVGRGDASFSLRSSALYLAPLHTEVAFPHLVEVDHPGVNEVVDTVDFSGAYNRVVKPVIDFVAAALLLIVFLPVLIFLFAAVRIKLGPGVIYRQRRVGRDGRPFTMYKFRSMLLDRRRAQVPFAGVDRRVCHKRDDDPRHTPFGRILRRSKMDELPQLWNVMKGDMSLVGPRPELVEVVDRYEPWQHERHKVKPGLTGFWQISPRANGLAYEGVDLDIDYLRELSFVTDCRVLLRTVRVTVRQAVS